MGGRDHACWRQPEEAPSAEALPAAAIDKPHVRGAGFGQYTTMSAATQIATTRFLGGYNCAQAVLCAFCAEASLSENAALKIATGLGAGMGRKQEVCGAVTGGILVLGLRHGRDSTGDRSAAELTYLKTRELMDRFAARHGSCLCRELLQGYDLGTEEGQRRAKADDVVNKVCRPCVQTVVKILEDMQ